jgi:hypothetical protein
MLIDYGKLLIAKQHCLESQIDLCKERILNTDNEALKNEYLSRLSILENNLLSVIKFLNSPVPLPKPKRKKWWKI